MARYEAMTTDFEEVTIFGKPALFTPIRIDHSTVPVGFYLYEVRHDDDCQGDAVQIAQSIAVNHWGSLVTKDEIQLSADGYLDIEPEDLNYGTGDCRNMGTLWQSIRLIMVARGTSNMAYKLLPTKEDDSLFFRDNQKVIHFLVLL